MAPQFLRHAALVLALTALSLPAVAAQYLQHRDPKLPRNPDGSANLTAPAPRLPDGAIDLSGLWNAVDGKL